MPVDPGGRKRGLSAPSRPRKRPTVQAVPPDQQDRQRAARTAATPPDQQDRQREARAQRAAPVTPPDQQDRRRVARKRNFQRGAPPTGGPGRAEIRRTSRLLRRAEQGKASVSELQRHLVSSGFDIAVDGVWGPQTQHAWQSYVGGLATGQAQHAAEQYRRQRDYLRTHFYSPGDPEVERQLFGPSGMEELQKARRDAAILIDRAAEREQYQAPEVPDEGGFMGEITEGLKRAQGIYGGLGRAALGAEKAVAEGLISNIRQNPAEWATNPALALGKTRGAFEVFAGPESYKLSQGDFNVDPKWLALEAVLIPFRPLAAGRAGVRGAVELVRLRGLKVAKEAAQASYRGQGVSARGAGRLREYIVGKHVSRRESARSQFGRGLEAVEDLLRDTRLGTAVTGGIPAAAGRTERYSAKFRMDVMQLDPAMLRKHHQALRRLRHVGPDQEYSLRVLSEGKTAEERVRWHLEQSTKFPKDDVRHFYHLAHADLSAASAKYTMLNPAWHEGANPQEIPRVILKPDAPRKLKSAWKWFRSTGKLREGLLEELTGVQDNAIYQKLSPVRAEARLHAPGRVMSGAEWKSFETLAKEELDASPVRRQFFDYYDETQDEATARASKSFFDHIIRAQAQEEKISVTEVLDRIQGLHRIGDVSEFPEKTLYQASWAEGEDPFAFRQLTNKNLKVQEAYGKAFDRTGDHGFAASMATLAAVQDGDRELLQELLKTYNQGSTLFQRFPLHRPDDLYPYYLKSLDVLTQMPEKFGAQEFLGKLKKEGVKEDEIKWSGLAGFLQGKKSVTKEETYTWLVNNSIEVDENIRYMPRVGEEQDYFRTGQDNADITRFQTWTLKGDMKGTYKELTLRLPEERYGQMYKYEQHFPEPNILAHIRMSDRQIDGKNTLVIEEIQSDWHQAGQKVGYRESALEDDPDYREALGEIEKWKGVVDSFNERFPELAQLNAPMVRAELENLHRAREYKGGKFIADSDGGIHVVRGEAPPQTVTHYYRGSATTARLEAEKWTEWAALSEDDSNALKVDMMNLLDSKERLGMAMSRRDAISRKVLGSQVADAPFKKTWHELAFKRMLQHAVDHGYEQLAWTTGRQQVERYQLGTYIERLDVNTVYPDNSDEMYREASYAWESEDPEDWATMPDEPQRDDFEEWDEDMGEYVFDEPAFDSALDDYYTEREQAYDAARENFEQSFFENYEPESNDIVYELTGWKRDEATGELRSVEFTAEESELDDYVGRDIAEEIRRGQTRFEGDDLVLGENGASVPGAVLFYDKKLTGFAQKYLKRHGVQVRKGRLEQPAKFEGHVKQLIGQYTTGRGDVYGSYIDALKAQHEFWPETTPQVRSGYAFDKDEYARGITREEGQIMPAEQAPYTSDLERTAKYFVEVDGVIHGPFRDKLAAGSRLWDELRPSLFEEGPSHGQPLHTIDVSDELRQFVKNGQQLFQRGGSLDIISPWGIKGGIVFDPEDYANIFLTSASDVTTVPHELSHALRRMLTPSQERKIARYFGATVSNTDARRAAVEAGVDIPPPEYTWSVEAEERFAKAMEGMIYHGTFPKGAVNEFTALSHAFQEVLEAGDVPNVPPNIAKALRKFLKFKKAKGAGLIGAEDWSYGVEYAPTLRGQPFTVRDWHRQPGAYMRQLSLFGGGRKRAIGAGPDDKTLHQAFRGSSLLFGNFRRDVIGPKADSSILAIRMSAAAVMRKALVDAGSDIPIHPDDYAVLVDPRKGAPKDLQHFFDKVEELGHGKLREKDLEGVNFDVIERSREFVIPEEIDGKPIAQAAREVLNSQEPIPNVKWVNRDFVEATGLLYVPVAGRNREKALKRLYRAGGLTLDVMNDLVKAQLLWLNPAYIPAQFIGNTVMNLMHQGPFAIVSGYKSVAMVRQMALEHRLLMDTMMGEGIAGGIRPSGAVFGNLLEALHHYSSVGADVLPRRMAWIHEAGKDGYKTIAEMEALLKAVRAGDEEALKISEQISRRARRSIVDFDRMSPFERDVVTRWIFFYPWLRGATNYSIDFVKDHPIQAVAIALMYEHFKAAQEDIIGDHPYYAGLDVPISTDTVGLKVPWTDMDIGLSDAIGEHKWTRDQDGKAIPMTFKLRQALTQTTPFEMAQSIQAFVGGEREGGLDVVSHLTPIPYAAGVALFGYDPYKGRETGVGPATFWNEVSPSQSPAVDRLRKIFFMSEEERKAKNVETLYPRSRQDEALRFFLGSLGPTPYNPRIGQERVLEKMPSFDRKKQNLIWDAEEAGVPGPSDLVLEELKWHEEVFKGWRTMDELERAKRSAEIFDKRYKTGGAMSRAIPSLVSKGQAKAFYENLNPRIYPNYNAYSNQIERIIDFKVDNLPND